MQHDLFSSGRDLGLMSNVFMYLFIYLFIYLLDRAVTGHSPLTVAVRLQQQMHGNTTLDFTNIQIQIFKLTF